MTALVRIGRSPSSDVARNPGGTILPWVVVPFAVALAVAAGVFAVVGVSDDGMHAALLATARWQFLLFWLAYAGGACAALFGPRFLPLRRHVREFGLGFAAALAVHLGLVAWLCTIGDVPPVRTFIVFGFAALCVYGLAVFSIARLQQLLGVRAWATLRFLAMNYVLLAFADDFLRDPLASGIRHALLYWPFAALVIAGPTLRLAAFVSAYHASRRASPV